MQGRNRAAAMGAACTVDEHCGTLGGRRLISRLPYLRLRPPSATPMPAELAQA